VRALTLIGELVLVGLAAILIRRFATGQWRTRLMFGVKAYLTMRVMALILFHEVEGVTVYEVLRERVGGLDALAFIGFTLLATGIKLVGIGASIARWILMLRGQGIELPLRHIVGAFFTGRFLGTFLPSTLGLDGYKLYDASRFSGRTVEVSAATLVEKLLGGSGIFGTFLIALPFGISIFGDQAALVATLGVPVALAPLGIVAVAFFWPGPVLVRWILQRLPLPTLRNMLERIAEGASAYSRRKALLLVAWALSLVQHFTTAAMYYFTARALGVDPLDAGFWEVTLASSIQILATVLSPVTIAGEGIRELAQGLLLQNQMTFAVAAASGLLGFLAAEAPTLLGAIPWLVRGESYRPEYSRVHGEQVDYEVARRAATDIGVTTEGVEAEAHPDPLLPRVARGLLLGLGAGLYAGLIIGFGEATYLLLRGKVVEEAQVFWAAPLVYGLLFGSAGAGGGAVLGFLPLARSVLERSVPPLGFVTCLVPYSFMMTVFFLFRDVYAEHMPPITTLGVVALIYLVVALVALVVVWTITGTRLRGILRAKVALPLFVGAVALAATVGGRYGPETQALRESRSSPPHLASAPNVLFIIVDTLRADHLSVYGESPVQTPVLDGLARGGTVFEAAFSQASWTKPAVASILTSLYPSSHGAILKPSRLPDSVVTVGEAFSGFGYTTGAIVTNINLTPSFNFQQGFDEFHYLAPDYLFGAQDSTSRLLLYEVGRRVAGRLAGGVRPGQAYQPADVVNEAGLEWLDRHGQERFFLWLHYMDPHDPYFLHPDDGQAVARATTPHPDPSMKDDIERRYRAEVRYLDEQLGMLMEELRSRGLDDNLLIVLTADHGEEFLDHGGWWHGLTLYDEQIHIPLVLRWPKGKARAPDRWPSQVRSIDVAPTLLSYVGAPVPPSMAGENVLARPNVERVVFAEEDHEGNVLQAVRTQGFKLIRANPDNPRGLEPLELYDVRSDPKERSTLAALKPHRAQTLLGDLISLELAAQASAQAASEVTEISDAECERLKALGYVEECP
jgi:arylsulfatase A-like enzyme